MQKTDCFIIGIKLIVQKNYPDVANTILRNGLHAEEEITMETESMELEVLDEGRESTEEVNSCCSGAQART